MARHSRDLLVDEHAVQRQLQRKSGHRRKELLQLAKASRLRMRGGTTHCPGSNS